MCLIPVSRMGNLVERMPQPLMRSARSPVGSDRYDRVLLSKPSLEPEGSPLLAPTSEGSYHCQLGVDCAA